MAAPTLSTTIFRRSILATTTAAATAAALALPMAAAPSATTVPAPPDPDAELFRRIAEAEHWRKRHARACRLRDRLWAAMAHRAVEAPLPWLAADPAGPVKWAEIAAVAGHGPATMGWSRLFRRYARAVRAAVAMPAHTVPGVCAKLDLALIAARRGDARIYLYEDHAYVTAALADLRRIADREEPAHRV